MLNRWQRTAAYLRYLRRPARNFLPVLLALVVTLLLGAVLFHRLYEQEPLTFRRSLYVTYCLIFNEHLLPFPRHWVLQLFYILLPPMGLIAILDGIVQFSIHVLRRDVTSSDWNQAMAKTLNEHVILVGLGKVGLRTLQTLLALGADVVVLEKDSENPNLAFARNNGVPVLIGGGREQGILDQLNVEKARSIILATDDDLVNLELAMDARKAKPQIRVVLRMFDQELASKVKESFDIQVAFSTSALAAPVLATSSADRCIKNAFTIDDRLLVVAEVTVHDDSELSGMEVGLLRRQHDVLVLSYDRGQGAKLNPMSKLELAPADRLVIQCEPQTLRWVHEINGDPRPY